MFMQIFYIYIKITFTNMFSKFFIILFSFSLTILYVYSGKVIFANDAFLNDIYRASLLELQIVCDRNLACFKIFITCTSLTRPARGAYDLSMQAVLRNVDLMSITISPYVKVAKDLKYLQTESVIIGQVTQVLKKRKRISGLLHQYATIKKEKLVHPSVSVLSASFFAK